MSYYTLNMHFNIQNNNYTVYGHIFFPEEKQVNISGGK